eukprot:g6009.t1
MTLRTLPSSTRNSFVSKVNDRLALTRRGQVATRQVTRAAYETQIVISAANATCLALGRWGFLAYQRKSVEKAGMPVQNGQTHAEAGDIRAQEVTFLTATKDPAGFNLIDVLAWGSIGHVLGFIILATNQSLSLG